MSDCLQQRWKGLGTPGGRGWEMKPLIQLKKARSGILPKLAKGLFTFLLLELHYKRLPVTRTR